MSYRLFRNIGQLTLAACAVFFGATSLSAQTAASAPNPSRVDVFLGYSYFGAHGQVKPANLPYSSVDEGAIGSGAYYFNKYVGAEVLGISNPDGNNDGLFSGYAGPIFRAPMQNFTLFAHGMAGGTRLAGPNNQGVVEHEPYTWGPSLLVGGGMDYDLPFFNHHFGVRLFEADYRFTHADFGPAVTPPTGGTLGGRANLSGAELSAGILFHFGNIIPPPPITYSCAVTAPTGTIYPGDPVTITGTGANLMPKKVATYTWTSDAGKVSGTSNVASIDTKGLSAGTYTVKGHVAEGSKPGQMADCSVPFTIVSFVPPTVGCSANPSTVDKAGDPSTITANGLTSQNWTPLTYSYSATAGTISGTTSTATLSTAGAAPGTITVTCNVVDSKGQTASQTTTVTVPASVADVKHYETQSLCSVSFARDKKKSPTRVNNEEKPCLDDITLTLQRQADAKLAIVGNSAPSTAKGSDKYAAERAVDTKAYLVSEKGIDASRISVYTGSAGTDTAATTLIPPGATLSMTGLTPVDEGTVKPIARNPGKKHKK